MSQQSRDRKHVEVMVTIPEEGNEEREEEVVAIARSLGETHINDKKPADSGKQRFNPTAEEFQFTTSEMPFLPSKAIFLSQYFSKFPKAYLDHVITPGYDAEEVPHLPHHVYSTCEDFWETIKGREEAATALHRHIVDKRSRTKWTCLLKPIAKDFMEKVKEDIQSKFTRPGYVYSPPFMPISAKMYGYYAFACHTIFMHELDLIQFTNAMKRKIEVMKGSGVW
ncbi:hypothetical protein EJ08DRAFT_397227 [Tothia fuscella]|uniref:Uncharacterized protein n=1 Tax=Tothia fuscella TaxID=1048955 RepID=A0A9P4NLF0_9PEZI|nr:hypothetical protein EJ08DRAFT_397227 [Tothia fuscella]